MGFDWTTFLFEVVNFLVLLGILERIVYRPLRRGIASRRRAIEEREQAATRAAEEAAAQRRASEQRMRELDRLRTETLRAATEQAAEERAHMLAQAREDAAAERARAQRVLATEREAALARVNELAIERSTELAGRLLLTLAPEAVDQALWAQMLAAIERQAEALKRALARASEDSGAGAEQSSGPMPARTAEETPEIDVICPRMPAEADMARLRELLEATLGMVPRLHVREDASLVAGVAVRLAHQVIDASLKGQLEAVRDHARALLGASPEPAPVEAHV
jgi:F-type H+-transporting ATPase subunit b